VCFLFEDCSFWNQKVQAASYRWQAVDDALGATQALQDRNLRRTADACVGSSSQPQLTYIRTRKHSRNAAAQDIGEDDSDAQEDGDAAAEAEQQQTQEATRDMDESKSIGGEAVADAFCLDADLL
jgi:hypothetical protein